MSNPSSPESLAALSVEEKEELLRSMKKVKANSSEFPSAPHKVITYKDTLPSNALQLIELGFSFFGVKFMYVDDFDVIAKGGPWFINGCFLTMRRWHPNFSASEATLHSVVVWVRIIKLPLEYYDSEVLVKIDHSIGTLLRANNALSSKMRGKYDRFLIQVNIVDPLKKWPKVDGSM
ncbi:hypothetical protein GOBAR_AA39975 [Gossypium barbadense]|uniref:DUF4283 domain-containing protein n=1 Tax=Gossypium barbadense TaxID=3634 RepID=A0A2P5VPF4_GOSBA|nr:hypothetical protein GOBAR_AA39975 [Gossypium barbadense]